MAGNGDGIEPSNATSSGKTKLALVTFCNATASPENVFALVDLATGNLKEIPFDYDLADVGATGLASLPDGTFVLSLPGSHRLVRYSPTLNLMSGVFDNQLAEPHSIAVSGDSLFVTATSNDSVSEYRIQASDFELVNVHRLSDSGSDSLHVNSVCAYQDRILVSMFGENWRNQPLGMPIGSIVDLKNQTSVSTSLSHPHTLIVYDEELYILGSFTGTVERVKASGQRTVCARYPGYLRGLSFHDEGAIVGLSGRRKRSKGLGTPNVGFQDFDSRCGILCYDRQWECKHFIDLTWFGSEIFELFIFDSAVAIPSIQDSLEASQHRSIQLAATWESPFDRLSAPTAGQGNLG